MENLNIIKTVEDLKELPISDEWDIVELHRIGKSDKYFIGRGYKDGFVIFEKGDFLGQLYESCNKFVLQLVLKNSYYELIFETLKEAFEFLIKKVEE